MTQESAKNPICDPILPSKAALLALKIVNYEQKREDCLRPQENCCKDWKGKD
jgi:hypothetical protein